MSLFLRRHVEFVEVTIEGEKVVRMTRLDTERNRCKRGRRRGSDDKRIKKKENVNLKVWNGFMVMKNDDETRKTICNNCSTKLAVKVSGTNIYTYEA